MRNVPGPNLRRRRRLRLRLHLHLRPAYLVVLLPLLKSAVLTVLLPARPALPA